MLLLLFTIDENLYGLEAKQILEVWPFLPLKAVSKAPDYVAGLINIRGCIVPVIDVSKLYANKHAANKISTRIILINIKDSHGEERILGILAEQVTDTIKIDGSVVESIGVKSDEGKLVGEEYLVDGKFIQKLNINNLIQDDLYDQLFMQS